MRSSPPYQRAAGGPVEHWNLPDLEHTRVLRDRPQEYARRVTAFFDTTLTHDAKDQR